MKLVWSKRALRTIEGIHDEIAAEQPRAAKWVTREIRTTAELLRRYPYTARSLARKDCFSFAVPRTKYILLFRLRADTVTVLTIVHGAQDWQKSFG